MTRAEAELQRRVGQLEEQLLHERMLRETMETQHALELADRRLEHLITLAQAILVSDSARELPDVIQLAKAGLNLAEHLLEEEDVEGSQ